MPKTIELLLLESVDELGIVGDVVRVKPGYARNFLLPMGLATEPNEETIAALAQRRAEAEREAKLERSRRQEIVQRLEGVEITLERSCNDQGLLYGSVTAKDLADALTEHGYGVRPRDVRLPQAIKRIDTHLVPIKLDHDLETEIKVWVVPDRELDLDEREEMEFDNEGNLIVKPKAAQTQPGADEAVGEGAAAMSAPTPDADASAG